MFGAMPTTMNERNVPTTPAMIQGRRMPNRDVVASDRRPAIGCDTSANSEPMAVTMPSCTGTWSRLTSPCSLTDRPPRIGVRIAKKRPNDARAKVGV